MKFILATLFCNLIIANDSCERFEKKLDTCCKSLSNQIENLIDIIASTPSCEIVPIDSVPVVINKSGKYCVINELNYSDTEAAIIVNADNVSINFANHSLTLTNPQSTGILIDGRKEVTILNDAISYTTRSTVPGSAAIHILNSEKVSINTAYIFNAYDAILVENSSTVSVNDTRIKESFHTAFAALDSKDITLDTLSLQNTLADYTLAGIVFAGNSETIYLRYLTLLNTSLLFTDSTHAILADHITSVLDDPSSSDPLLQLGDSDIAATEKVKNAFIKQSNFSRISSHAEPHSTIFIPSAEGIIIEDSVLENNGISSGITVWIASLSNNIQLNHNIFHGNAFYGINAAATRGNVQRGLIFENNQIHETREAAIVLGNASNAVIQKNTISRNLKHGIRITNHSDLTAVIENVVSSNGANGIEVSNSDKCHLQKNAVYANNGAGIIIDASATNTETYFNTSCNNGGPNCVNVSFALNPSDPQVVGYNICCNEE